MKNENPQPGSNDRDELARLLPAPPERDLPSGRRRRIQEFVVNHIQDQGASAPAPRPTRRRFALATGALAAVAAAAVVLNIAGGGSGGNLDPGGPPAVVEPEAARAFEMAASYAAVQPWTEPRPDQWFYLKHHRTRGGAAVEWKQMDKDSVDENWYRVDGKKGATYDEAGTLVALLNEGWSTTEYPWLVTLPTEPAALLAALRQQILDRAAGIPTGGQTGSWNVPQTEQAWNELIFSRIGYILSDNLLPPGLTAGLYRAAAQIPGVSVAPAPVMIDGRETTAVGMIVEGWRLEQLLLDPETHEYVGYRSVAIADYTYPSGDGASASPSETGPDAVTEKRGQLLLETIRLAAVIVDEPGEKS